MNRPLYPDYSAIEADLPALLEIALLALHHDTCEFFLLENHTNLNWDELTRLRDKLERHMQADTPAGSTGSPLARALAAVGGDYHDTTTSYTYSPRNLEQTASAARRIATDLAYMVGEVDFRAAGQQAYDAVYQEERP